MNRYDTIIIGGGISGMVAGIALAEGGQKVALFSSGKSCMNYFSGSFDLFAEGLEGVEKLIAGGVSTHPYMAVGTERIVRYTKQIKDIFASVGMPLVGSAEKNHFRLTPLGVLKPAWLSLQEFATFESADNLVCRKICVVGIGGYLDFNPEFVARSFCRLGVECVCHSVSLSAPLRLGIGGKLSPSEAKEFALGVSKVAEDCDLVLLPALFDLHDKITCNMVYDVVGERVRFVPTTSVSCTGVSVQKALRERFEALGGDLYDNERVVAVDMTGDRATLLRTSSGATFGATNFVLATGSFFGGGVVGSPTKIYEPLADLDVVAAENRTEWTSEKLFSAQPFEQFGVLVNESLHPSKGGVVIDNLYAVGSILAGSDGVKEGSGGGVALCSGLMAAELIIKG